MPKNLDMQRAMAEIEEKLPGVAAHLEADNPGMHTTDTIDFEYVLSGEVWLELDDGKEVHLKAGDTVVQNGTRHAWRNKHTEPCRLAFCLIGARRR
jgi:quercetin dioxygenase-like cupin family protein